MHDEGRRRRRARLLRLVPDGEDGLAKITQVAELDGKKVGITSAGSGSDILALWTMQNRKIKFTRVPLGGGGLVPNLLSGNIDAMVLYSPLSFKMMQEKQARSLIDYGARGAGALERRCGSPPTSSSRRSRQVLQKALNAHLRRPSPSCKTDKPRRGGQDDRRDRRDPASRSPRPSSTATSPSCRRRAR